MTTEVIFPEGVIPVNLEGYRYGGHRHQKFYPKYSPEEGKPLTLATDTVTRFDIEGTEIGIIDRKRSGTIIMVGEDHHDHRSIGVGERTTIPNKFEIVNKTNF